LIVRKIVKIVARCHILRLKGSAFSRSFSWIQFWIYGILILREGRDKGSIGKMRGIKNKGKNRKIVGSREREKAEGGKQERPDKSCVWSFHCKCQIFSGHSFRARVIP